jgi:hypothetical protein
MTIKLSGAKAPTYRPGINQALGVATPCYDHWHCCAPDKVDHGCGEAYPAVDSVCPTCGAISMPGAAVTPAYHAERQRRLAESICLRTRGGRFLCDRKVSATIRAAGTCLCARHGSR